MYGMHVLQLKARAGCMTRSGQAAEWPSVAGHLLPAQSTQAGRPPAWKHAHVPVICPNDLPKDCWQSGSKRLTCWRWSRCSLWTGPQRPGLLQSPQRRALPHACHAGARPRGPAQVWRARPHHLMQRRPQSLAFTDHAAISTTGAAQPGICSGAGYRQAAANSSPKIPQVAILTPPHRPDAHACCSCLGSTVLQPRP